MKKFLTLSFALWTLGFGLWTSTAPAATIIFQYQSPFGQAIAPSISLQPPPAPVYQSNTLVLSGMVTFPWNTNGVAVDAYGNTNWYGWTNGVSGQPQLRLPLSAGSYTVYVAGFPRSYSLAVPSSTNTFFASDLSSNTIILSPQPFILTLLAGPGILISQSNGTNVAQIDPALVVTNNENGVSLSNLTVNGASPLTASTGAYFTSGTLTNSYLITDSPFPWLNVPVYWNQFLSSTYGSLVYTNTAANGMPVFLAYNDPALAGGINNINEFWDISTNFNVGSSPLYVNAFSTQDNNSNLTNLFGSVWQYFPGHVQGSVQILAQQPTPTYRLFMFQPTFSAATNQVIAFAGASPFSLASLGAVFTDTNPGVNDLIRDVCHVAYTDNTGKTTYLLSWSHYFVGQGMGLATSPDDVNYTFCSYVPLTCSSSFSNQACWSPKIFVNATNGLEVTALLGPTNSGATPTNIFVGELSPITFTNPSVMRVLTTDANIGGAAALYSKGVYYYYSSSGVVWTNTALASTGWKSSWTNSAMMIGGSVCSYAGALYWFSTFGGGSPTYSTATNYAGPWSASATMPFPAADFAQGDGTFLPINSPIQGAVLTTANNPLTGVFQGSFSGNGAALTNVASAASAGVASNVVSGLSITNAFITNSVFSGNGAGLTALNASQLTAGMVPAAQLPYVAQGATVNLTNLSAGNGSVLTNLYVPTIAFAGAANNVALNGQCFMPNGTQPTAQGNQGSGNYQGMPLSVGVYSNLSFGISFPGFPSPTNLYAAIEIGNQIVMSNILSGPQTATSSAAYTNWGGQSFNQTTNGGRAMLIFGGLSNAVQYSIPGAYIYWSMQKVQ